MTVAVDLSELVEGLLELGERKLAGTVEFVGGGCREAYTQRHVHAALGQGAAAALAHFPEAHTQK